MDSQNTYIRGSEEPNSKCACGLLRLSPRFIIKYKYHCCPCCLANINCFDINYILAEELGVRRVDLIDSAQTDDTHLSSSSITVERKVSRGKRLSGARYSARSIGILHVCIISHCIMCIRDDIYC
jgi:hypothetical protein